MIKYFVIFPFFCIQHLFCLSSLLEKMSVEEKVGQILMVSFCGEYANEEAKILIQDVKVGGIIYYTWANGLNSKDQVRNLSFSLQKLTQENPVPLPLLLSIDQEGGVVSRLENGFTSFPGNRALALTKNPSFAFSSAYAMGLEMHNVGINMNLAPVVDISDNPIIGTRSFGDSSDVVINFAKKAIEGYQAAKLISTLKHFPGLGSVAIDSHKELPVSYKSIQRLEKEDLLPFSILSSSVDVIMTGHILSVLDHKNCATLSKKALLYLREKIHFTGVIISDSLVMQALFQKGVSIEEISIEALNAGCDILLLGGKFLHKEGVHAPLKAPDVQKIHEAIVHAIHRKKIPMQRLNSAVEKVLWLKKKYLLGKSGVDYKNVGTKLDISQHKVLAKNISTHSIFLSKKPLFSIKKFFKKNITIFAPEILRSRLLSTFFSYKDIFFFQENIPDSKAKTLKKKAESGEGIVIFIHKAWKDPLQISFVQSLLGINKPNIVVVTTDPIDNSLFSTADGIINTFSPAVSSMEAMVDFLDTF